MNWCCEPQKTNQTQNIYVSNNYQPFTQSRKQKFSFRTAATKRLDTSQISQTSKYSNRICQLQELQREYENLKQEQRIVDEFQRYRIAELQNEILYFQRQLQSRTRQIAELRELFIIKLNQRRWLVQQSYSQQINKRRAAAVDQISNSTQP